MCVYCITYCTEDKVKIHYTVWLQGCNLRSSNIAGNNAYRLLLYMYMTVCEISIIANCQSDYYIYVIMYYRIVLFPWL